MKKYLILILFCFPFLARATTLVVSVDTLDSTVNALEGTLKIPAGVSVSNISTGNSAILFWLTEPKAGAEEISFSGIAPGGFSGARNIFSLTGDFDPSLAAKFTFVNTKALANDGQGTELKVKFAVQEQALPPDKNPPESFLPVVGQDPEIFDGRYFLAFSTVDKGVGVDHYEVSEGFFGSYRRAVSPYELTNQKLDSRIYVKAFDKNGNIRVASIPAPKPTKWWEHYTLFAIIIVFGILIYLGKKLWPSSTN